MFAIAMSVGALIVAVASLAYAVKVGNDTENVWREFNRGTGIRGGSVRPERASR